MVDPFFKLLADAGQVEIERILSSDAEFDRWLKANPLPPEEQKRVQDVTQRLAARFRWNAFQKECDEMVKRPRSCNMHSNCQEADQAAAAKGKTANHCSDEGCEDCFGK